MVRRRGFDMAINRTIEVAVDITPEELAEAFWSMRSEQQAKFFNHLYDITDGLLCFQLQAVTDDAGLNANGRYAMRLIGDYSEESK